MANQKFSVEEILKEYQSDEATANKKGTPSGKLETQKMLNNAAGRRKVPPSTEASAEAYSYAASRTRQRTPYSPYRSEMAANINGIKQQRYARRTDVEESRTAAFQTLELMRPKVSFVRSPAINPQTTPNPKSDHISDYDGAVLLETPEAETKPEQPAYQPAIQEMQDSTRAKEKKQAQNSRKPKKRTEQSYQRESFNEPEPEWRKTKPEKKKTQPEPETQTATLQDTLRAAQEAVAKAEKPEQPEKKQPFSHAWETLLTSPAKQQQRQEKKQQEKKQSSASRWFSSRKKPAKFSHSAPLTYPEPAEVYRTKETPQPESSDTPPVFEPQPESRDTPPVFEPQPESSYVPPVFEPQPESSYAPPVQESQPESSYVPPIPESQPEDTNTSVVHPKKAKKKKQKQQKSKQPKQQKQPKQKKSQKRSEVPTVQPEPERPLEEPIQEHWTEESTTEHWAKESIPGRWAEESTTEHWAEEPVSVAEAVSEESNAVASSVEEENLSYTARFRKVVAQESTYTDPERKTTSKKTKKEKLPKVKVQKPVPPAPKPIPNQEAEIRININLLRNAVFFRTVSLTILTIIGMFLAIGESRYTLLYPVLARLMTVRGYCVIHLVLGLLILFITFPTVANGLKNLLHREADSDSIAAMPLIPCLLTVISIIFVPEPMERNLVHIFLPVSSFILLMNSVGKLFIIRRATRNFSLLTKAFEKYILTCVQNETVAETLTRGAVRDYPILATVRKTNQMSDFLRHTYASDLADQFSRKLAPIVGCISLLLAAAITGIRIGVLESPAQNIPFFFSVLTMLLTAGCTAGIPLTVNMPLDSASKRLCPHSCTLLGYQSVDDFFDVNAVMLPASALFPKGSVKISGIKKFGGFQVEEALLDAASLVYAADSILQNAFAELVEEQTGMLYQVEDCNYEDSLGLCGWIRHRRVLLGNREMMTTHNIEGLPTKIRELELADGNQDVLYLSVSGVLAAMFVVDITADPMVKRQMRCLKEEQIHVILKSVDSSVTLGRLATLFAVPDSMLKILPAADDDLFVQETAPLQDVSAATIHNGSFFGTARLLLEAKRIKRAATAGLLLQVIAAILGLSICCGYILVNGYDNMTSQTLLFYQLVMTALTVFATRLK